MTRYIRYIKTVDELAKTVWGIRKGEWVIAKPISATGLLKWKIRFIYSLACLTGKAIAVRFKECLDENCNEINMYD